MSSSKALLYHPSCDGYYPNSELTGHCSQCHITTFGQVAFDQHQFHLDNKVYCMDPAGSGDELWRLDPQGRWHYGEQMTDEKKKEIWG